MRRALKASQRKQQQRSRAVNRGRGRCRSVEASEASCLHLGFRRGGPLDAWKTVQHPHKCAEGDKTMSLPSQERRRRGQNIDPNKWENNTKNKQSGGGGVKEAGDPLLLE